VEFVRSNPQEQDWLPFFSGDTQPKSMTLRILPKVGICIPAPDAIIDQLVKRRWNISIWAGFAIVIAAFVSYILLFAMFPVTRDVPWANYLLFVAGGGLLAVGLRRAFIDPTHYRGKVSGSILAGFSVLLCALFVAGVLYFGKQIPSAESALRVGQPAPSFTLLDVAGRQMALSDLLNSHRSVVLVFYRGYW
jgi:AhpC/TSA family